MTTAVSHDLSAAPSNGMLESLGRIKVPKSCDVLADKLKQEILGDTYPPGAALPTERELVLATGLSRGSVREALRILEAQGLVVTRAGRYGGSTVAQPSDTLLASHINLFAKGRSVPLRSLVEVRQALEPMVAYLAARHRTEDDLVELRNISERLDAAVPTDVAGFLEENVNWHNALAAASHNELLSALMLSVSELMFEASRIDNFASGEVRKRVSHAHHRILAAIEASDADAARRRVERDVQAYAELLEAAVVANGAVLALNPSKVAQ